MSHRAARTRARVVVTSEHSIARRIASAIGPCVSQMRMLRAGIGRCQSRGMSRRDGARMSEAEVHALFDRLFSAALPDRMYSTRSRPRDGNGPHSWRASIRQSSASTRNACRCTATWKNCAVCVVGAMAAQPRLRDELEEANARDREKAMDRKPPAAVRAYRQVYGHDPCGWPPA